MAEIRPLRPWRYNPSLATKIEELTSPLFDVVSDKQREKLYKEQYNSIHLSVPSGEKPAEHAKEVLQQWKSEGVIEQDKIPGIYVYYQHFNLPGSNKTYIRKGFIANIRLYDWDEKVLLRHENTMPHSVNDRVAVLESTQLNVSPTHGLYTDATHELEAYMDESMKNPIYEIEDFQGVKDVFSVIHDGEVIKRFINLLSDKEIILADGHHRYSGSLEYMKRRREENPDHTGEEGYNFHLMYFTNTESDDLRILPTHRLVHGLENFDEEQFIEQAREDFIVKPLDNPNDIHEIILGKPWAFGVIFPQSAYKLRLKPESLSKMTWNFPQVVKELDLTVMHYFIIEKLLGVKGESQRNNRNVTFERSFTSCMTSVYFGESQLAIITQEIHIDEVKEVCHSGYTMPMKSTYFYPKAICGFLFSSIADDEFDLYPVPGL